MNIERNSLFMPNREYTLFSSTHEACTKIDF